MTTEAETSVPNGAHDTAASDLNPIERIASRMGWVPRDQFKGDEDKWTDAEAYLERSADVMSQLKIDRERDKKKLDQVNKTAQRIIADNYEKAKKQAEADLKSAIKSGDEGQIEEAAKAISDLPTKAELNRAQREFQEKNPWWGTDDDATAYAWGVAERARQQGMDHEEQLEAVEKAVRKKFPELFEDVDPDPGKREPRSEPKPAPVTQGGTRSAAAAPRKKDWPSIPADVRKAAQPMIKAGMCTEESYAKSYWEINA